MNAVGGHLAPISGQMADHRTAHRANLGEQAQHKALKRPRKREVAAEFFPALLMLI